MTPTPEANRTPSALLRRFSLHGDALSRIMGWGVRNVPPLLEPFLLWWYSSIFWLIAGKQRRAIAANLRVMFPGEGALRSQLRAWHVFWNFACTEVEAVRCLQLDAKFDWEVEGREHFEELAAADDGAMILTAHMSNYDVAAYLFAKRLRKPLHTVRAPEATPELQAYKEAERERFFQGRLRIHYNTLPEAQLGVELLRAVQEGDVVAIQGDRLIGQAATARADFGGVPAELPSGPFALAAAAKCRVFPLFIVRRGHRRYRIVCKPPIVVTRNRTPGEGRHPLEDAMDAWGRVLAEVSRKYWYQWFVFEPLFTEGVKMPPTKQDNSQLRDLNPAELAPSRCLTARHKLRNYRKLKRALKSGPPVVSSEPGVEVYFAGEPGKNAYEITEVESLVISVFLALCLYSLHLLGVSWWVLVLLALTSGAWLAIPYQLFLITCLILSRGLRTLLPHIEIAPAQWNWRVFQVTLTFCTWLLLYCHLHLGEKQIIPTVLAIGAFHWWIHVALNSVAALDITFFRKREIAELEAQLPLNKLPEHFGSDV